MPDRSHRIRRGITSCSRVGVLFARGRLVRAQRCAVVLLLVSSQKGDGVEERPNRNKQEFRALRELAGITQQSLAKELDVNPLSVKRWESPKYPQQAPTEAWQFLDNLCTATCVYKRGIFLHFFEVRAL